MASTGELSLEFRLLGTFEVAASGRAVEISSPKQRALLALLVIHLDRPVSFDTIIDQLWQGRPPASVQATLQSLVYRLRRALADAGAEAAGVALRSSTSGYVLEGDRLQVDAHRFCSLVGRGRELLAAGAPDRAVRTLADGLALWRGPALDGVADMDVARAEATRLEEVRLDAVETLAAAELARDRPEAVLALLEPHVAEHPLREGAWGQLMVAFYRLGRQAEALRAYQQLRRVLGEELGLEPNPALRKLEQQILLQSPELEGSPPVRVGVGADTRPAARSSHRPGRTPLVGREAELGQLRAALDETMAGSGGVVMVTGEPGIGKTRLTEELAAAALRRRALVFVGRCLEAEGAPPYAPVVEILENALGQAPNPEAFRMAAGDGAPEIARLVPRLRRLFPDIGPALALPPEQERRYLFNATAEMLARTASAVPTVLVFEDLHWADEATLLLLDHLARQLTATPVLIVGTYRDAEFDIRPALARTLDGLVRDRLIRRLPLARLREEALAELLGALAGHDAPDTVVDLVFKETEGNPFFVEEVFRHLAEEGRLLDADGRFLADVAIGTFDVPENVRLVVGRRLDRLSDDTRRVLEVGAVIGRTFRYELLEAATSPPDSDVVLEAIETAERARLVVAGTDHAGGEELGFVHELVRQTLLARLSAPRRRRLHVTVAAAMERVLGRSADDHAADLAHHLVEAGAAADPATTVRWLVLAGRRAVDVSAFEDALRAFEQALALGTEDAALRASLQVDLARAQRSVGRWDEAVVTSGTAIDAYEALGDLDAVGRITADTSWALCWLARFGDAHAMAQRGLSAVVGRDTPERGYLLATLGMTTGTVAESHDAAMEMLDEAAALADRLGDDRLAAHVNEHRMHLEWYRVRHRQAVDAGRTAAAGHQAAGNVWDRAMTLGFVVFSLAQLGRFAEVDELLEELEPLAQRLGNFPTLIFCNRSRMVTDLCRAADFDALDGYIERDFEINTAIGGAWCGQAFTWRGLARFWRGNWEAAGSDFEEGMRRDPDGPFVGWGGGLAFLHRAHMGDREGALVLLADRRDDLPRPGRSASWGPWMMLAGVIEGLVVLGEREQAAEFHTVIAEAVDAGVLTVNYHDGRLLERLAGMAAAAGNQWEKAEAHFEAALRLADELPHRIEALETRRYYGQMLLDRQGPGDEKQAVRLLDEAIRGYRLLGMPRHSELAETVLGE